MILLKNDIEPEPSFNVCTDVCGWYTLPSFDHADVIHALHSPSFIVDIDN